MKLNTNDLFIYLFIFQITKDFTLLFNFTKNFNHTYQFQFIKVYQFSLKLNN